MLFGIGLTGLGLLLAIAFIFGIAVQLVLGPRVGSQWLWLIAATGWFVGGLFASEVVWGGLTVDEIQPIIDGLALDESLLGGLIGGVIAVIATLRVRRNRPSHEPTSP